MFTRDFKGSTDLIVKYIFLYVNIGVTAMVEISSYVARVHRVNYKNLGSFANIHAKLNQYTHIEEMYKISKFKISLKEGTLFETKTKSKRNSTKKRVIALKFGMAVALKRYNVELKKRRRNRCYRRIIFSG